MSKDERLNLLEQSTASIEPKASRSNNATRATTAIDGRFSSSDDKSSTAIATSQPNSTQHEFHATPPEDSLSDLQGLMHLLKATIGTGVLAMPGAIRHAGVVAGPVGIALIALVSLHCAKLLVRIARRLRAETGQQRMDYEAVSGLAFSQGPQRLRSLAGPSRIVLNSVMLMNQLGLVSVYYLYVCENVGIFVSDITGHQQPLIYFTGGFLIAFLSYVFLRSLKLMAPLALLANVCMTVVLACIVAYCCLDLRPVSEFRAVKGMDTLPLFLGVVLFAFESINLVLPIENKLRNKDVMVRTCGILDVSVYLVIAIYTAVGFYGYLRYGDAVKEAITYSLPNSPWYMASLKLIYSFSVFVSYGLQYYLLVFIMWHWLQPWVSTRLQKPAEFGLRVSIVLFSFALPMLVPHLDLMIALLGSLGGCTIIFIYPPMLHSVLLWTEREYNSWWWLVLAKNFLLITFGIFALFVSTYLAIAEIVRTF